MNKWGTLNIGLNAIEYTPTKRETTEYAVVAVNASPVNTVYQEKIIARGRVRASGYCNAADFITLNTDYLAGTAKTLNIDVNNVSYINATYKITDLKMHMELGNRNIIFDIEFMEA